jgi:N-methylhydantoinase B
MVTTLADRAKFPALGLFGGEPGRLAHYLLVADDRTRAISSKRTMQIQCGEILRVETCGGGGYGDPHERNPQAVLQDVRQGKVSAERARTLYGVSVREDGTLDEEETSSLRTEGIEGKR